MIKPDLLVVQPIHLDFPGFRYQVSKFRHYFNKVIIAWSQHNLEIDVCDWVENVSKKDDITFVSWQEVQAHSAPDWGQRVISTSMNYIKSSYVLISQQDFIINNDSFFDLVLNTEADLVTHLGYKNPSTTYLEGRCEPDFILMTMDLWNRTSKNVQADPPLHDHWGVWSLEAKSLCKELKTLEDFDLISSRDWKHLQHLCLSYYFLMTDQIGSLPVGFRSSFIEYNRFLLTLGIEIEPQTEILIQKAANLDGEF